MKLIYTILVVVIGWSFTNSSSINIGDTAPEIALPGTQGDTLRLSDLKGKVVLINFWASWCRPCRVNNHLYKKVYAKYKDSLFTIGEGFEIYSVSMDHDAAQWKAAISNDKINWTSHVSDLLAWESPVANAYGVGSLPFNCIIDGNGLVVGKNIHRSELENFLISFQQ